MTLLILQLTGCLPPSQSTRDLLALPCHHGGLGLVKPTVLGSQYSSSCTVTSALAQKIKSQEHSLGDTAAYIAEEKQKVLSSTRSAR